MEWRAAFALLAGTAHAGDALFSTIDQDLYGKALSLDESFAALANDPASSSIRLVKANLDVVNEKAGSLTLNLGPGLDIVAHRVNSYDMKTGSFVWSGVIEDLGATTVPFAPGFVRSGQLRHAGQERRHDHRQRPLRGRLVPDPAAQPGGHAIVAVNSGRHAPGPPGRVRHSARIPMPARRATNDKANTVIRVMVNYTASAASASGNISALIDLAVAESNQGYTNSGVLIT